VRVAYKRKEKVTHCFLLDALGQPTDDPAVLFLPEEGPRGAMVSFAAHKGYALARSASSWQRRSPAAPPPVRKISR